MKHNKLHYKFLYAPLAMLAFVGAAQADSPFDGVTVVNDCLTECAAPSFDTVDEFVAYMAERLSPTIAEGEGGGPTGAGGSPEGANGPAGIGFGLGLGLS